MPRNATGKILDKVHGSQDRAACSGGAGGATAPPTFSSFST